MVVVDTSVWIDYLTGHLNAEAKWLDDHLSSEKICITDLALCEVLQGVRTDASFVRVRAQLAGLNVLPCGGEALAIAAALNYRALRDKGITTRKTIDCMIATFCMENGHVLLHRDRDYESFERHLGLRVIHP